jgi:hypothetical protein
LQAAPLVGTVCGHWGVGQLDIDTLHVEPLHVAVAAQHVSYAQVNVGSEQGAPWMGTADGQPPPEDVEPLEPVAVAPGPVDPVVPAPPEPADAVLPAPPEPTAMVPPHATRTTSAGESARIRPIKG